MTSQLTYRIRFEFGRGRSGHSVPRRLRRGGAGCGGLGRRRYNRSAGRVAGGLFRAREGARLRPGSHVREKIPQFVLEPLDPLRPHNHLLVQFAELPLAGRLFVLFGRRYSSDGSPKINLGRVERGNSTGSSGSRGNRRRIPVIGENRSRELAIGRYKGRRGPDWFCSRRGGGWRGDGRSGRGRVRIVLQLAPV